MSVFVHAIYCIFMLMETSEKVAFVVKTVRNLRNAKIRPYAVYVLKIKQYEVRKGGGFALINGVFPTCK